MASNTKARRPRSPALSHPAICSGVPSFRKTIADESPQFLIFFEDGFTPPAQLIGSGGVKRRITPAREGVSSQFPRHGGFRSLKRPGYGADRAAGRPHDRDLVSFLVQQV
jgi:hypothetical protein